MKTHALAVGLELVQRRELKNAASFSKRLRRQRLCASNPPRPPPSPPILRRRVNEPEGHRLRLRAADFVRPQRDEGPRPHVLELAGQLSTPPPWEHSTINSSPKATLRFELRASSASLASRSTSASACPIQNSCSTRKSIFRMTRA